MPTRREFLAQGAALLSAAEIAEAQGTSVRPLPVILPPPRGAHIGSLLPFIEKLVPREFPLSFLRDEHKDLEAWKRQGRAKAFELMQYAPAAVEPKAEVLSRVDKGAYIQENIVFSTTPDIRVPAAMLIPKNMKGPAPAVVALHDHGGFYMWGREKLLENDNEHPVLTEFKQTYYAGRPIAADLARQGYVVLIIDMFYWGERRMLMDDDPDEWKQRSPAMSAKSLRLFNQQSGLSEQLVGRTILAAGATWSGIMFWDDIRSVDYLVTRPEVDRARIGCVGLSIGGLRACHLAAFDERIKASVVVGWMASFPAQLKTHIRSTIGFTKLIPGLYRHMDYPDIAALAMPNAMMVINGDRDGLFDLDGVKTCFTQLAACYKKAGIPEKLSTRLFAAPHEFNEAMQAEAWQWLRRWLR